MMDMFDLAGLLFGSNRTNQDAATVTATGAASSEDGVASITMDADVTPAEDVDEDADQTVIDLPTSPDVAEGDEVIVTLVGDGPLKTPVVTANPGAGDRMRELANSAKTIADAAQAVAEAVNQHFFADDNGIHVTEATQDEWNESHTGANVLINSIGQLFRDGLNNLLTLTTEDGARALTIWDGLGNAAENVRARFGTTIRLGSDEDPMLDIKDGWMYFYPTADDVQSLYFGPTSRIQRPLNGALKISSDVGLGLVGPTLGLDNNSGTAQSFAMENVIAMLSTASSSLTRGSGASSWTSGQVRRSGKAVVVTLVGMKLAAALSSGSNSPVVTNVPAGYRPNVLQRVPVALNGGAGDYANVWAVVGAGGNIQIHNGSGLSIPTTMEISMNCCYIID